MGVGQDLDDVGSGRRLRKCVSGVRRYRLSSHYATFAMAIRQDFRLASRPPAIIHPVAAFQSRVVQFSLPTA